MISIIAAVADNGVIGRGNDLPWRLSADLKYFKRITTGHTVVMGRRTYQSIVERLGGPLPDRHNVVVTRDQSFLAPGSTVVHSIEAALQSTDDDILVIGGAEIYRQALPLADRLYLTEVKANIGDGDSFFPDIDPKQWREVDRQSHRGDADNQYDYAFVVYDRI